MIKLIFRIELLTERYTMPRIETILPLLTDEILRAHRYYGIAKTLREKSQEPEFALVSHLFSGSYFACIRESLLAVSKLIIADRESICMEYLFNYAEQNTGEFAQTSPEEVSILISSARNDIHALEPLAGKMRQLRDTELAHLDKRHINDPKSIIPVPIQFDELESCLTLLIQILNRFLALHGSPQVLFEDYYELSLQEVDLILSALKNRKTQPLT